MKKQLCLSIIGIFAGELMIFSGQVYMGIAIHVINLQAITLGLIFSNLSSDIKNSLQSLILLLLLRIVGLGMPQFFTASLLWYPLIYGVIFIPELIIIKNQHISLKEIGIDFKRLNIYFPAGITIGLGIGIIEYLILKPNPLIENFAFSNLILITIVMFVFVAAIEELLFRSIIQTRFEKVLGLKYSVLFSGFLFGIMHAGFGIMNEILFACIFGIFLGYTFQKTRSFPLILFIHGAANVSLFGLLPFIL